MIEVTKEVLYELMEVAQRAGEIIMTYYDGEKTFGVTSKSDQSPVTEADQAASDFILKLLKEKFPETPALSEESPDEHFNHYKSWPEYFLIDPLDGTKEFIKGSGEFTVNIALIRNNRVEAGVVDLPVLKETYYGSRDESYVSRNGMEFKLPIEDYKEGKLRVVSTKSHKNEATKKYIENIPEKFGEIESKSFGSSLKICKVAEGVADLNPRLGTGTKEWDIAAGHAVLLGAGGNIVELGTRKEVGYTKDVLLNPEYEAKRKELLKFTELSV